jgi:hypothetical protein
MVFLSGSGCNVSRDSSAADNFHGNGQKKNTTKNKTAIFLLLRSSPAYDKQYFYIVFTNVPSTKKMTSPYSKLPVSHAPTIFTAFSAFT